MANDVSIGLLSMSLASFLFLNTSYARLEGLSFILTCAWYAQGPVRRRRGVPISRSVCTAPSALSIFILTSFHPRTFRQRVCPSQCPQAAFHALFCSIWWQFGPRRLMENDSWRVRVLRRLVRTRRRSSACCTLRLEPIEDLAGRCCSHVEV